MQRNDSIYFGDETEKKQDSTWELDPSQYELVTKQRDVAGHTVFLLGPEQYRLTVLHAVTRDELNAIFSDLPALRYSASIQKISKHNEDRYKIYLGQGHYSKVQLARLVKHGNRQEYVAVRKLHSHAYYEKHHKDGAEARSKTFESLQTEIGLHKKLSDLLSTKTDPVAALTRHAIRTGNNDETDQLYQIMPLYDCGTLHQLEKILDIFPLTKQERFDYVRYLAVQQMRKLIKLHENDIFHRDYKPDNVLVSAAGDVVLADFGCASYRNQDKQVYVSTTSDLHYCPPKFLGTKTAQLSDIKLDQHKDIWALGLTICMTLGGVIKAFVEKTYLSYIISQKDNPPDITQLMPIYNKKKSELLDLLRDEDVAKDIIRLIDMLLEHDDENVKSLQEIAACMEWDLAVCRAGYAPKYNMIITQRLRLFQISADLIDHGQHRVVSDLLLLIGMLIRRDSFSYDEQYRKNIEDCIKIINANATEDTSVLNDITQLLHECLDISGCSLLKEICSSLETIQHLDDVAAALSSLRNIYNKVSYNAGDLDHFACADSTMNMQVSARPSKLLTNVNMLFAVTSPVKPVTAEARPHNESTERVKKRLFK